MSEADDDPWWALREILEAKAPSLIETIEQGFGVYSDGGMKALGAWLGVPLSGPDDDPWWAMSEIVQARQAAARATIADGLDVYANSGREALGTWLASGAPHERATTLHARAMFRGDATAPDQSAKARVAPLVLIECVDEHEQLALLGRMRQEGLKCRALI